MVFLPTDLLDIVRNQAAPNQKIYLVGGLLRDRLLKLPSHDLDFALKESAIQLGRRAADNCKGDFYILDQERGTARVLVKAEDGSHLTLDFANFRGDTIEEDLSNRDFTANALAADLNDLDRIIDPFKGQQDIKSGILRSCSPTSFPDDAVRVLRAVRFSIRLGFRIDPETEDGLRKAVPLLKQASVERQRDELFHILGGSRISQAMRGLEKYCILPVLLPELVPLLNYSQSSQHAHDAWEHTLAVLDYCEQILDALLGLSCKQTGNLFIQAAIKQIQPYQQQLKKYFNDQLNPLRTLRSDFMFAALYHDVGKPATRSEEANGSIHFINHEFIAANLARDRSKALALSNDEVNYIEDVIRNHMHIHLLVKNENLNFRKAAYRFFQAAGKAGVADCLFSLTDLLATYEEKMDPKRWNAGLDMCVKLLDAWFNHYSEMICPPILLNGDDLQSQFNLSPDPLIGQLLAKLEEAQAVGKVNSKAEAMKYITSILSASQEADDNEDSETVY